LLLPKGISAQLSAEEFQAIISHELCHVRRRDNLTAVAHMAVEAVFWFHPLVWWLGARIMEERERACDEEVLKTGTEPRIYAEGILKICQFYIESPLRCVAGVTGGVLTKRIEAIMSNRAPSDSAL
jgi:beta-lactamase regulating signal transducer with metallopeptidase domain